MLKTNSINSNLLILWGSWSIFQLFIQGWWCQRRLHRLCRRLALFAVIFTRRASTCTNMIEKTKLGENLATTYWRSSTLTLYRPQAYLDALSAPPSPLPLQRLSLHGFRILSFLFGCGRSSRKSVSWLKGTYGGKDFAGFIEKWME